MTASILLVTANPLARRDAERFGALYFAERGHRVESVDISALCHPGLAFPPAESVDGIVNHIADTHAALKALKPLFRAADLVIFAAQSFGPYRGNLEALRLVSASRAPYVIFSAGDMPIATSNMPANAGPLFGALKWRLFQSSMRDRLIRRLPLALLGLRPADFFVSACLRTTHSNPLVQPISRRIAAHSFDYDLYLKDVAGPTVQVEGAVYLDQWVPYHQDVIQVGGQLQPEQFYGTVCTLLERIERELGLKVTVAAHPRSDLAKLSHHLPNFHVEKGNSVRLVRSARLVITHCSTAAQFAVMAGRPLLITTTTDYYNLTPLVGAKMLGLAQAVGKPLLFCDYPETVDLSTAMTVDQAAYDRFLANYIKVPGSPDRLFWELVTETVNASGLASV